MLLVDKKGEIIFFDYLAQHRNEILENSYLDYSFETPTTPEELSCFLPGRSHYADSDELLRAIGKSNNMHFLRTKLSKIFLVPLRVLEVSDQDRFADVTKKVYASQQELGISHYHDVSLAAAPTNIVEHFLDGEEEDEVEYADAEFGCRHCLPIRGDAIVGTKMSCEADAPIVVHRLECPIAQQALNNARSAVNRNEAIGQPVKLVWSEEAEAWESGSETFLADVGIMANDRKLLLADCSEVASKNAEIIKTTSRSTAEHCTLNFLVRVSDLEELQVLMNKLIQVHSVMSGMLSSLSSFLCVLMLRLPCYSFTHSLCLFSVERKVSSSSIVFFH